MVCQVVRMKRGRRANEKSKQPTTTPSIRIAQHVIKRHISTNTFSYFMHPTNTSPLDAKIVMSNDFDDQLETSMNGKDAAAHPTTSDADPREDQATTNTSPTTKKRKPKPQTTLSSFTIRNPPWSYITLQLLTQANLSTIATVSTINSNSINATSTPSKPNPHQRTQGPILDELTIHLNLQAALRQFLGLHGTAISFDILKIEGQNIWIRVPREDASAVVAAVGGWIGKGGEGWRVINWGAWGPREVGDGRGLFG